jgi:hypothetical protein
MTLGSSVRDSNEHLVIGEVLALCRTDASSTVGKPA